MPIRRDHVYGVRVRFIGYNLLYTSRNKLHADAVNVVPTTITHIFFTCLIQDEANQQDVWDLEASQQAIEYRV